eukprot:9265795-Pyramimonas_sp.AAC.1
MLWRAEPALAKTDTASPRQLSTFQEVPRSRGSRASNIPFLFLAPWLLQALASGSAARGFSPPGPVAGGAPYLRAGLHRQPSGSPGTASEPSKRKYGRRWRVPKVKFSATTAVAVRTLKDRCAASIVAKSSVHVPNLWKTLVAPSRRT